MAGAVFHIRYTTDPRRSYGRYEKKRQAQRKIQQANNVVDGGFSAAAFDCCESYSFQDLVHVAGSNLPAPSNLYLRIAGSKQASRSEILSFREFSGTLQP
jgi:hypothetical protein